MPQDQPQPGVLQLPGSQNGRPEGDVRSPIIRGITTTTEKGSLVVSVATSGPVEHKEFALDNPSRLVIDFPNTDCRVRFQQLPVNSDQVKLVRIGQFQASSPKVTRLAFDLEADKVPHEIEKDDHSVRVIFHASASQDKPSQDSNRTAERLPVASNAPSPADERRHKATQDRAKTSAPVTPKVAVPEIQKSALLDPKPPAAQGPRPVEKLPVASNPPSPADKRHHEATQERAKASAPVNPDVAVPETQKSALLDPKPPAPRAAKKLPVASNSPSTADKLHDQAVAEGTKTSAPVNPDVAVPETQKSALLDPKPPASRAAKKLPVASNSPSTADLLHDQAVAEGAKTSAPVNPDVAVPETQKSALLDPKPPARSADPPTTPPASPAPAPAAPPAVTSVPIASLGQEPMFQGQPLTLDLVDIPLIDFFRLMAEEGGINIVMDPEIKGTISIKVVKVPWDQILEAALINNSLDKRLEGNLVRIARKATLQEEAKQQESLKKANLLAADLETRIKRLNYAKAGNLVGTLQDQKTVRGTAVVDERTNSLVLTDIPSSLDRLLHLIESLDIPQPQVQIEARIVSATRDFARAIGVQFGFVQGNLQRVSVGGPNTFGTIGGTRPSATPTNTFSAGDPSSGRGAAQSTSSQSGAVSTGTTNNTSGNWNVNLPAQKAFGGVGLSVGNILDTFLLDAAITAGESKGLAKLISQPKVTAQNNSPATITQGLRFPVQVIANNTVTIQFQNAALTLTVTPQITYEGNIVLDLKVENDTPDFSRQVNGVPSIQISESNTRVLVADGATTVIGGILIENQTTSEDRVPGLASLPLVGNFFRRSSIDRSTQEVLFFITPQIVK